MIDPVENLFLEDDDEEADKQEEEGEDMNHHQIIIEQGEEDTSVCRQEDVDGVVKGEQDVDEF